MSAELAVVPSKRIILLHAIFNVFLLHIGLLAVFISERLWVFGFLLCLMLATVAFVSILTIEALTCLAARHTGGRGSFWVQLHLTNLYLTPIFFIFSVALAVLSTFLPPGFRIGLDFLAFPLVVYMNHRKLAVVHPSADTTLPTVVYAITSVVAYGIWVTLLVAPLLFLS